MRVGPITTSFSPATRVHSRLLVVEDQVDTRNSLTETLLEAGYHVDQAIDGRDGLAKLSDGAYDGIVLDLVMPHVNGWQFREIALRDPGLARIPVVVVTVRPLRDADRYVLQTPYILQKPIEPAAVVSMVRQACAVAAPVTRPEPMVSKASEGLYWSRKGEVACPVHAPGPTDERWRAEGWTLIPTHAGKGRIVYQCQHCAQGPVLRRKLHG